MPCDLLVRAEHYHRIYRIHTVSRQNQAYYRVATKAIRVRPFVGTFGRVGMATPSDRTSLLDIRYGVCCVGIVHIQGQNNCTVATEARLELFRIYARLRVARTSEIVRQTIADIRTYVRCQHRINRQVQHISDAISLVISGFDVMVVIACLLVRLAVARPQIIFAGTDNCVVMQRDHLLVNRHAIRAVATERG